MKNVKKIRCKCQDIVLNIDKNVQEVRATDGELVTRSRYVFTAARPDHNKDVMCEVTNAALSVPLWVRGQLNIGCKC